MFSADICSYVDVFYGNGETDRFFDDGLASKWFYIKALCGNTIPHAVLPFGKMSVGAYSGGYSSGYGTHYPNGSGGIRKLGDKHLVRGFSHLHQSGVGGIKYYYNYAIASPIYGSVANIGKYRELKNEEGRPGYYKAELDDILCELTVDGGVAVHRYRFGSKGGRVAVDFLNNGLSKEFSEAFRGSVGNACVEIISENEAVFSGEFSGVRLYFCVKAECVSPVAKAFNGCKETSETKLNFISSDEPYGVVFDFEGDELVLRVNYSTLSTAKARESINNSVITFDESAESAYDIWNRHLSAIKIETDDEDLKKKFYSNLYHSLIKPVDMTGESVLGVEGDTVTDFATFWDQYKTALPLIYMCYHEMGDKIARGIVNISKTLGRLPCSFGLSNIFPCEEQAKMLGVLSLCDAYHMGVKSATVGAIEECTLRELERDDYRTFLEKGIFERYTHILDVTDACLDVAAISENAELKQRLSELAENWRVAYAQDGLMSEDSQYYEGDRYTYSFRVQKNMEERVDLAGGKERFSKLLDDFFGYNGDSVKQLTYIGAHKDIEKTNYHRFEGFNNECDMEAPYAYIYADRHDRLCEIVRECTYRSFGLGKSGLPGNNDSGGLTSMFVWNTLGIFPISGSGEFLIGSPQIDGAEIELQNGNRLTVRVSGRNSSSCIYVDRVEFNGRQITDYRILMKELMNGGELHFYMKGQCGCSN